MIEIVETVKGLEQVQGLGNIIILDDKDKKEIDRLESENNRGVREAIKRKYCIAMTHDSTFRKPAGDIVMDVGGKKIFPPVPFPEIKRKDVVSGSPGYEVHAYLVKRMKEVDEDDATLVVGFD